MVLISFLAPKGNDTFFFSFLYEGYIMHLIVWNISLNKHLHHLWIYNASCSLEYHLEQALALFCGYIEHLVLYNYSYLKALNLWHIF